MKLYNWPTFKNKNLVFLDCNVNIDIICYKYRIPLYGLKCYEVTNANFEYLMAQCISLSTTAVGTKWVLSL